MKLITAVVKPFKLDDVKDALKAAGIAEPKWKKPLEAAIHYRLGDLDGAKALASPPENEPWCAALSALWLHDRGQLAEAAQQLEDHEVGVLHRVELVEPPPRRRQVEPDDHHEDEEDRRSDQLLGIHGRTA